MRSRLQRAGLAPDVEGFRIQQVLWGVGAAVLAAGLGSLLWWSRGASVVALGRDVAERIGIDTASLRYDARIQTANGIAAAAPIVIDSLRVGSIERRNVRAMVTDGPGLGLSLLGMSFLGTLSSFDFRGDRLILTD